MTYETSADAAKHLDDYSASASREERKSFKRSRKRIGKILRRYFHKIDDFRLLLGPG